jgi:hypothetical protein
VLVVSACNPTTLPGIKTLVEQADARRSKRADEAIKNSPVLQELDRFCTSQVPPALGFQRLQRQLDEFRGRHVLTYSYKSDANFERVKQEHKNQLLPAGWRVTAEEAVSWGDPRIEFDGNSHSIRIYHFRSNQDVNYKIHCEKIQRQQ